MLKRLDDFVGQGLIAPGALDQLAPVAARYALGAPQAWLDLIDRDDPGDPLARQIVPDGRELIATPGEDGDPTGDMPHTMLKGLVHRYRDRVLLKPVQVCPLYCRFCFRREMVGPGQEALTPVEIDAALAYIAAHREIFEVILTGGDPLMLSPRRLAELLARLNAIDHVGVIRIHSRVPIAAPERLDDAMLTALQAPTKALWLSIHCNHARELGPNQRAGLGRLNAAGIALIAQSVLLKGVNDDLPSLIALCRALYSLKVKPAYLHHPDRAPGTNHFQVSIPRGQDLAQALAQALPGPARPTYVIDTPGGLGKAPLARNEVRVDQHGETHVTTYAGHQATLTAS